MLPVGTSQKTSAPFANTFRRRVHQTGRSLLRTNRALQSEVDKKLVYTDSLGASITYQRAQEFSSAEVANLITKVGWPAERLPSLELALQNSFFVGSLEASNRPEGESLVGLVRVVSDGVFNAQLWDTMIDPQYQGLELDQTLLREVIRDLIALGVSNITSFTGKSGVKQYEKLGFQADPDGVTGMYWRGGR